MYHMTFQEFLIEGFIGHYARHHLAGTAYALLTGGAILLCMLTYLVGSLNFSIIISKHYHNDDIRNYGSGNAGTTNMLRTYGRRAAVLTLIGDALKAIVSTLYGYALLGFTGAYVAGFFCILGHCFPIWYKFKGGKGIVTVAFMVLMLDPIVFAILFFIFFALVFATKMVSFGSVICVMLFPILLDRIEGPGIPVIFAMLITVLVVFMHRENILRIFHGEESKIDFAKLFSKKKQDK
jgi:glycerol-3-phosphate acyltransferase PlsY